VRKIALVVSLLVVSTITRAHAGPAVSGAETPEACRTWSDDIAAAKTDRLRVAARVSLAHCLLAERLRGIELQGDDASMKKLADAVAPTLAILDQVMQVSDPAQQIIAAQAKGDVYDAMVVRMRNTGRNGLEAQLAPWSRAANAAYADATRIAKQHPELANANPVVASAVREAEAHLAAAQGK
jgi:hypothetical protein